MKAFALLLAFLLLAAHRILAEDASPTPTAPFVASVPEKAHWTVTFSYGSPGAPPLAKPAVPTGHPAQIETIKSGGSYRFVVSYADGTTQTFDKIGGYIATTTATGVQLIRISPEFTPYIYYDADFLFAQWVRATGRSAYKGIATQNGKRCFHYLDPAQGEAWIDTQSRLPVTTQDSAATRATFQFSEPQDQLVFPDAEIKAVDHEEHVIKAFNSLR
jgi:hypothetical protein